VLTAARELIVNFPSGWLFLSLAASKLDSEDVTNFFEILLDAPRSQNGIFVGGSPPAAAAAVSCCRNGSWCRVDTIVAQGAQLQNSDTKHKYLQHG
jgi:hypothetical protein